MPMRTVSMARIVCLSFSPGHILPPFLSSTCRSLTLHDASRCFSNHGVETSSVPATLRALPEVLEAVNGQVEVLVDGGIRRGGDVAKALCLGARAVLVGRAYAYGLGAAGEAGVARAIEILRADVQRTLKLLGCAGVSELDPSYVELPDTWRGARPVGSPS